ncbi:hypothetical protein D1BOALGB6SA_4440 [Olavius sp. associated proteobacterium Delta 1]|nr:hypothetical protein D1BOALGB6SA_4440 [Olavius sp. associated proteobacterium Delta 1]
MLNLLKNRQNTLLRHSIFRIRYSIFDIRFFNIYYMRKSHFRLN